jgi:parvulin-like peptidyl-prolyl isomerase
VSEPVRSGAGFHVLQVLERQADAAPPLEQIAEQVLAEYRRRAGEHALRAYLDELRSRADIEVRSRD